MLAVLLLQATEFLSMSAVVAGASVDASNFNINGNISTNNNNNDGNTLRKTARKQSNKGKLESIVREQNLLPPLLREEDLPIANAHQKWMSLSADVEFIPADGIDRKIVHRFLEQGDYEEEEAEDETTETYGGMTGMESIYDVEPFVYGVDEYDEYQQAWRLMGFIVDCYPMVDDDYYQNGGSGSGDEETEDGCARYVLWAAVS